MIPAGLTFAERLVVKEFVEPACSLVLRFHALHGGAEAASANASLGLLDDHPCVAAAFQVTAGCQLHDSAGACDLLVVNGALGNRATVAISDDEVVGGAAVSPVELAGDVLDVGRGARPADQVEFGAGEIPKLTRSPL